MKVTGKRAALAGLWSVRGIAEKSIAYLGNSFDLAELATRPPSEWLPRTRLFHFQKLRLEGPTLQERAERMLDDAERLGMRVAFADEPEYPEMLRQIGAHPPLMFFRGVGEVAGKRRVAMVGTRHADNDFRGVSTQLAFSIAQQGIGVISGAAMGVDTECHKGALLAGGETWAVLGSSIDQIDPHPKTVVDYLLDHGGTVWSDYPPGVRGEKPFFVRRDRLIAWMGDATIMTRGDSDSGALYTVQKALDWRRPVLVVPGEIVIKQAMGTNSLLRVPGVAPCLSVRDVLVTLGLAAEDILQHGIKYDPRSPISPRAEQALAALGKHQLEFDQWLERVEMTPSELKSSFVELEMVGRVVETSGKVYVARR